MVKIIKVISIPLKHCVSHEHTTFFSAWGFTSHSRIFHSYEDVTITSEQLYSALMALEQCGFYSVPHLLWHRASVYNCHLGEPVILIPVAKRLAVELSLPVFYDLGLSRLGFEHPIFRMRGKRSNRLRHRDKKKITVDLHVHISSSIFQKDGTFKLFRYIMFVFKN